jgi:hypothetical protein
MARKEKRRVEVEIPADFRQFMKQVAHLIAIGDEAATVESDDLLQCERAYGGLCDGAQKSYSFRFFPGAQEGVSSAAEKEPKFGPYWDFLFTESDINGIAHGNVTRVPLWRCANSECQCRHDSSDRYCPNCDNVLDYCDVEGDLRRSHPDVPDDVISCMAKLERIAVAVLDYKEAMGRFPPPYTRDRKGEPLL